MVASIAQLIAELRDSFKSYYESQGCKKIGTAVPAVLRKV